MALLLTAAVSLLFGRPDAIRTDGSTDSARAHASELALGLYHLEDREIALHREVQQAIAAVERLNVSSPSQMSVVSPSHRYVPVGLIGVASRVARHDIPAASLFLVIPIALLIIIIVPWCIFGRQAEQSHNSAQKEASPTGDKRILQDSLQKHSPPPSETRLPFALPHLRPSETSSSNLPSTAKLPPRIPGGITSPSAKHLSLPAGGITSPSANRLSPSGLSSENTQMVMGSVTSLQTAPGSMTSLQATRGNEVEVDGRLVRVDSWSGMPWSVTSMQSVPKLCPLHNMARGKQTYKVHESTMKLLYNRSPIEILGAFDYPVAYARLYTGPGGSRLEVTSDPTWKIVDATVGPLDFPALLSPDAFVHGPRRVLYGKFQKTGAGFSVSHYSRAESVLIVAPKLVTDGISVQLTSNSGTQRALVEWSRGVGDISISTPGEVDMFLIIATVLASFVSSQQIIDTLCSIESI